MADLREMVKWADLVEIVADLVTGLFFKSFVIFVFFGVIFVRGRGVGILSRC
jgi:hypothetical protein